MEYITYKEFEEEVNKMGYSVEMTELHVVIRRNDDDDDNDNDNDNDIVATISTKRTHVLDLYWWTHINMFIWDREEIASICWQLASTPLSYREEPKAYYLKVCQKYLPFFSSPYKYLNLVRHTGATCISDKGETTLCKTIFTEEEINELSKEYDLSLFEKIEVEND